MNPKLTMEWIAALRSGTYKQGREYLSKGGCDCCLGVACWIARIPYEVNCDNEVEFDGQNRTMPPSACERLGIQATGDFTVRGAEVFSNFRVGGTDYGLSSVNDRGTGFPVIADIIYTALVYDQLFNTQLIQPNE